MWWSAFGNTVEDGTVHWVGDDLLIGEAFFVGRHVGSFAGIPASGAEIYDLNGLLRQLGQPSFLPPTLLSAGGGT
jgi:hypothetical protein